LLRTLVLYGELPEYRIPIDIEPRVILDIGANIGAATVVFARRYPDAQIYAFEPQPENYELLVHNAGQFPHVTPVPYGLGERTETLTYYRSNDPRNFGGGGFCCGEGSEHLATGSLPVLSTSDALMRYNITEVDLVKIDAEGAEYAVFKAFPPAVLANVKVIVGECHGSETHDGTLGLLTPHFNLDVKQRGNCTHFTVINKQLSVESSGRAVSQA